MSLGFRIHPGGMFENSPTFQRWVADRKKPSVTKGWLKSCACSAVPSGLRSHWALVPNVETLGYYHMSLRDKELVWSHKCFRGPNPSGIGQERPRSAQHALLACKFHHRLGMAVDVQLLVDSLNVGANRAQADAKIARDLFVGMAFRERLKYFHFARGESIGLGACRRLSRRPRLERLHDFARDIPGHWRTSGVHLA